MGSALTELTIYRNIGKSIDAALKINVVLFWALKHA
jgi:hypothetical protein